MPTENPTCHPELGAGSKKPNAFTLAEVLITLGIIGVVAAMTLPTLIQKQQEKVTVTQLKKFYSAISQAYAISLNEYGSPDCWDGITALKDLESNKNFAKKILENIQVLNTCYEGRDVCYPELGRYTYLNGIKEPDNETLGEVYASTKEGFLVGFRIINVGCNLERGVHNNLQNQCAEITVDINGLKNPNKFGIDKFDFLVTKTGIMPYGVQGQYKDVVAKTGEYIENCFEIGWGCSSWVIHNGNMDYLRCPNDLSWNGKTKCK